MDIRHLKQDCFDFYEFNNQKNYDICGKSQMLATLFSKYSHAEILVELYSLMSIKEAIECFENIKGLNDFSKTIKTIGVHYWKMYDGGVEKVLSAHMQIWHEMGYRVVLYTSEGPCEKDYAYPDSVKRVVIPAERCVPERLRILEKSLKEEQVDIFVNNAWMSASVLWELILIKSLDIPYILYTHGDFTFMYHSLDVYALNHFKVFRLSDIVLTLTEVTARFYKLCGCNVRLVYNPLPYGSTQTLERSALDAHKILWIGRITEIKRPLDAIRIFKLVKDKILDAELDIVGTGEEDLLDKMKSLSEAEGICDSVHFHGYQVDTAKYYQRCSLLLMTSEREGYPTVLLESKAYGVPCVMYELPCSSSLQGGKGILTSPVGDIQTNADHIIDILVDVDKRQMLGREAKESYEFLRAYDIKRMWDDIFQAITDKDVIFTEDDKKDRELLLMLADQMEKGMVKASSLSVEFQLGRKLLAFPRMVKQILKKII